MATPVIRLGLVGHGTVGAALATIVRSSAARLERSLGIHLQLAHVAVRRPALHRARLRGIPVSDDPLQLADDPSVDILIEASGAPGAAYWLNRALDRGATVVSANKFAVARDPQLLAALARGEPRLLIEASVVAAVPIVRALRESLAGEDVRVIRGVLNATSTFVLSQVERGRSLDDALLRAQQLGFAEANSASDLDGSDAAAKLALLATIAWHVPVPIERVDVRGVGPDLIPEVREAARLGQRVRLVATAVRDGAVRAAVRPVALEPADALFRANDEINVVELDTALAGTLVWTGAGAGGTRTASALLGDVIAAARGLGHRSARVAA